MSYNPNEYSLQFLTEEDTLEVEDELDELNLYFNKLKVFIDQGVEGVLSITEEASTLAGYDYEIKYSIEEVTYTVYYSFIDEETNEETTDTEKEKDEEQEFTLVGLMVIDGVEYQLEGANEIEGTESEMWFETVNNEDIDNSVRVEIKKENNEQKFEVESVIDGVESSAEIKFEEEENETKVELELQNGGEESYYEFKKETTEEGTVYKFDYEINGVEGEIEVTEVVDDQGNVSYLYDIEEEGRTKEIEKDDDDIDDKETNEEDTI